MPETSGNGAADSGDSGARAAFEDAHARLGPWVRRLLRERCGAGPEEDLSQAVWAAVWRAMESGSYDPGRAAVSTFVFAVMQNTWRRWVRDRKPVAGMDAEPAGIDPSDPAALAEEAEYLEQVRGLLDPGNSDLSSQDRRVLRLVASGAGDREIARELGCSPSTANARKRAALAVLRGLLIPRVNRAPAAQPETTPRVPHA